MRPIVMVGGRQSLNVYMYICPVDSRCLRALFWEWKLCNNRFHVQRVERNVSGSRCRQRTKGFVSVTVLFTIQISDISVASN